MSGDAKEPPRVAVIGGGPAGLMAAERLAEAGLHVTVYDRMERAGRKFLLAGRGGLNLTHSEPFDDFLARYREAAPWLRPIMEAFPPAALRSWCEGLGVATFVGSSGRVFPKALKASPLLRAWLARLTSLGVRFMPKHRWVGWTGAGALRFVDATGRTLEARPAATLLALGGASWSRLGSDGGWVDVLRDRGVKIKPLQPANCGFTVGWSDYFRRKFAGTPLKSIAVTFDGASARGEAMITGAGLEGGVIYALSAALRDAIAATGDAKIFVDLKPDSSRADIARRLAAPRRRQSTATFLRKSVGLPSVAIALLHEAADGKLPVDPDALAALVKAAPLRLIAPAPIERAISTAGGIALDELDRHLMLRRLPGVFAAGEMLDWEAPTGGYLLQACFATGAEAARGIQTWLDHSKA
ncbi:MAG: NAD(P)/FAD-dependent oxidoreductase [Alphaproteobacteria bacterium]